ncbi:MAG: HlyD family efflux transporter periplasmic adaptor subunit [Anaerolineae bacterium]|nr:HlyD family efflux transporter periplasmic adaptor subunit [Anaerolineae bacterium]
MTVKHIALRLCSGQALLFHLSGQVIFLTLVLILWTSAACGAPSTGASPTPTVRLSAHDEAPAPLAAAQTAGTSVVSAEGEVVPVKQATLSFEVTGRLVELLVSEGDAVEVGQTVARFNQTDGQQRVDEAQAALELAQAQLMQAKAGARPEEIAAAQEVLAAAQAGVSTAKANLASAQAELARLEAGAKPEELVAAQAVMDKAAVALQLAQSEYDKIAWQSGLGATQQAVALRKASDDYEIAKAKYEALVRGATAEELDIARAAVEAARARVDVAQAQAGQAKAQLDQLLAGPTAEAITVAEAQIQQAQAALEAAQVALDQATLRAPFAGTVAALEVSASETVLPGQVVLTLADLSHLQAETTDLSERDVDEVAVGQQATVYVEALGSEIAGRVVRIANQAGKIGGDVVYTVVVELDEQPPDLRWGMSVDVGITTE